MEELGLVSFLRQNNSPEIMSIVFPSPDDTKISPDEFLQVTDFGNEYNRSDGTIEFFKRFLRDLNDGLISKFVLPRCSQCRQMSRLFEIRMGPCCY